MQEYTCVCLVQTQFESCKMCINQLHVAEPFQWTLLTVIPYGPDAHTDVLCVRCSGPPSHLLAPCFQSCWHRILFWSQYEINS